MKNLKRISSLMIMIMIVFIVIEVILRCFYFQVLGTKTTAIALYYDKLNNVVDIKDLSKRMITFQPLDPDHQKKFYNDQAFDKEREELFVKYETIFKEFQKLSNEIGSALVVLYVPGTIDGNVFAQDFYEKLTSDCSVPYLDACTAFARYDKEKIYTANGSHALSPYGHQMLAKYLYDSLARYLSFKNITTFAERPTLLGDLAPSTNVLWTEGLGKEYRVVTNSQGLRHYRDVVFPRAYNSARIVCIGGSMTFGPYVDNGQTYTSILESSLNDVVAINAGILDYTICDEYSYLKAKGQYLEPDIILLQVTDSDLYGLYPHIQKKYCRGGAFCIR
jgi:hypothetical protein